MNWNRKELRKGAWNTVFKRGTMAWLALVAVCFIFAFLGVDEFAQSTFVYGSYGYILAHLFFLLSILLR